MRSLLVPYVGDFGDCIDRARLRLLRQFAEIAASRSSGSGSAHEQAQSVHFARAECASPAEAQC
ncbi:MAG: hypothetical protein IPM54_30685 [Polyangiaceae bacterium]|nr:hypothetical protein [Polyangiaceae bacterium]